jgi:DNA-directed RNA polymerase sigma subunit (sigma70/sigma32)
MSKVKTTRNRRIVELYDNPPAGKRYTFRSLAGMFQITEKRVRELYYEEKARQIESK